mmetsp:Transcript_43062/g.126589  ORF Transcript_43062/g.126589 Transcript_43062/m.126589 type:complete len:155 (+) Transcript_43062:744-1208(+)
MLQPGIDYCEYDDCDGCYYCCEVLDRQALVNWTHVLSAISLQAAMRGWRVRGYPLGNTYLDNMFIQEERRAAMLSELRARHTQAFELRAAVQVQAAARAHLLRCGLVRAHARSLPSTQYYIRRVFGKKRYTFDFLTFDRAADAPVDVVALTAII